MKKYIAPLAILAAALSMAGSAHAQAATTGTGTGTTQTTTTTQVPLAAKRVNAQKIMWDVLTKLNVTEMQKTKIKDLVKANAEEAKELRKSVKAGTTTKEEAKTKQKEMHKALLESIKGTLTPSQAQQFEPLLKEETKKARQEAKEGTGTTAKVGG